MSGQQGTGPFPNQRPEPRIGDADREAAARALGEHYAAGRITKEEYDERSDVAFGARTASELRPLFVDLPSAGTRAGVPPPPSPQPRPASSRSPWRALPLLPMIAVVAVIVAMLSGAWWLLFVFGWMFFAGSGRHCRRG